MHNVPKSTSEAVLSRVLLTLRATRRTPHGASRLVQAKAAWSVKTLRALSWHCRDVRVYGHTTAAMHGNEYALGKITFNLTLMGSTPRLDAPSQSLSHPA